jgi:hypothetical protein
MRDTHMRQAPDDSACCCAYTGSRECGRYRSYGDYGTKAWDGECGKAGNQPQAASDCGACSSSGSRLAPYCATATRVILIFLTTIACDNTDLIPPDSSFFEILNHRIRVRHVIEESDHSFCTDIHCGHGITSSICYF